MGIRLTDSGFQSRASAQFAGSRALTEFLEALAKEKKENAKPLAQSKLVERGAIFLTMEQTAEEHRARRAD